MQTIDQATHFEFTLGRDLVRTESGNWMLPAYALEDEVNALIESLKDQDVVIGIGGRIVDTRYAGVASAYGTGKMSIRTRANKGSGSFDVWVRPGDTFRLTVYPRG